MGRRTAEAAALTEPENGRPVPGPTAVPGLRHVTDAMPGIRRRRAGKGFSYLDEGGRRVEDPETLARIRSLAVPPAWTDVWISPLSNGHLQATGRDARGRKQYRYHPRWREFRDETKFSRLVDFGRALTPIRRRVDRDLRRPGLPRERVLAAVVRLLDTAFIRVGNEVYARDNDSFGVTTLRNRHAEVRGARIEFEFRSKGGKLRRLRLEDQRLARIVKRCRDLPGYDLFQYVADGGERRAVDSGAVNDYLREVAGQEITAKDFRTWAGTVLAARALSAQDPPESERQAQRNVKRAVEEVGRYLGNTAAIARRSYVHPEVVAAYEDGSLRPSWLRDLPRRPPAGRSRLRADEARLLRLLEERARAAGRAGRKAG